MSMQTWKDEYYPVPAAELRDGTLDEMLAHSLLKWEGLKRENLMAHGLNRLDGFYLYGPQNRTKFTINSTTCALCHGCTCRSLQQHINDEGEYVTDIENHVPRFLCPLEVVRGVPCDYLAEGEVRTPYHAGAVHGDVEPMLQLLQRAAKWLEENKDAAEILALAES